MLIVNSLIHIMCNKCNNVKLFELNVYFLFCLTQVPFNRCHIEQSKNFGPADYLSVTKQITDKGK